MRAVKANPDGNSYAMSMLLGSGGSIQEPDIDPGLHKSQGPKLTRTHTTELLTDSDVCEEVAVLGRRVVWAAGRSLRKSLTLQSEVIQKAVWTDFPEYGHRAVLCLLQPGCVTTCLAGGGLQDTPLASPVEHIWPCTLGLLLGSPHASGVRMITHPLDEPCPVLADVSLRAGCEGSYAGWSGEEVVWSSRSLPFVATHSKGAGRLALWLITKRAVRPTAIGNLPDLPAATPHPLHHLADTTPVNQVVSRGGSRPPSTAAAVPGAHTTSASMLDTPVSGGPASVAASGFSGWPSSVKRPVARTPEGRLSPSMFNPAPRGANTGLSLPALVKAGKAIGGFGASDARTVGREAPGSRVQAGLNTGLTGSRAIGADAGSLFDGAVSSVGVQMSRSGGLSLGGRSMSPVDPSGAASLEDSYLPLTGLPGLDGPRPVFCLLHEHDMQQVAVDAKPTEGHEVTDASGGLLLAVLCPDAQQLLVFTLPTTPAGRPGLHTCHPSQLPALAFTLPARAVAAVRATDTPAPRSPLGGRTMELLVLSPKGQLNVYQGSHQLCGISLPQAASPLQPPLQQQVHLQQTQPRHMQQQQQQQQQDINDALTPPAVPRGSAGVSIGSADRLPAMEGAGTGTAAEGDVMEDDMEIEMEESTPASMASVQPNGRASTAKKGLDCGSVGRFGMDGVPQQQGPHHHHHQEHQATTPAGFQGLTWSGPAAVPVGEARQGDSPVSLSHAWGRHVTLGMAGGNALELDVALKPRGHLQQLVMRVLRAVMDDGEYTGLLRDLYAHPDTCCGQISSEWDALIEVLLTRLPGGPSAFANPSTCGPQQQQQQQQQSQFKPQDPSELFDTPQRNKFAAMTLASPASPTLHRTQLPRTPAHTTSTAPPKASRKLGLDEPHLSGKEAWAGSSKCPGASSAWTALLRSKLHASTVARRRCPWMAPDVRSVTCVPNIALTRQADGWGKGSLEGKATGSADDQDRGLLQGGTGSADGWDKGVLQGKATGSAGSKGSKDAGAAVYASGMRVLRALHALYEDCKLNTLRWPLLLPLGRALARCAVALRAHAYWEHYARDVGPQDLGVEWPSTGAAAHACQPQLPLDVCRVLSRMLQGCPPPRGCLPSEEPLAHAHSAPGRLHGNQPSHPSQQQPAATPHPPDPCKAHTSQDQSTKGDSGGGGPGGEDPLPACCMPYTLRLLPSYQHLMQCSIRCSEVIASSQAAIQQSPMAASAGPTDSSTSAAIADTSNSSNSGSKSHSLARIAALHAAITTASWQVVLALLAQGWSPTELSSVPLGVGLPLQEALQRCRADPPQGWPPEAYALIGREDIAATLAAATPSTPLTSSAPASVAGTGASTAGTPSDQLWAAPTFLPPPATAQPASQLPSGLPPFDPYNHGLHQPHPKQHQQQQQQQQQLPHHTPLPAHHAPPLFSHETPVAHAGLPAMWGSYPLASPSPSPALPRAQLNLATPMLPHSSLPTPMHDLTPRPPFTYTPMQTSLSTPLHPSCPTPTPGTNESSSWTTEGVQGSHSAPSNSMQSAGGTQGGEQAQSHSIGISHVTFALPSPSLSSQQPMASIQQQQSMHPSQQQAGPARPAGPSFPALFPHQSRTAAAAAPAAAPAVFCTPSAASPPTALLSSTVPARPRASSAHDRQPVFGGGKWAEGEGWLGKGRGCGGDTCAGSSSPSSWAAWRPPYAHRLHLPVHHLDVGTRRAHLLAAAVQGGQSGGGQTSSAGQSVGPEALKLQEMWDGLEGLRRGATRLRFSRDARLAQVSSLLASSTPVSISLDVSELDPDLPLKQQQQLLAAANRTMVLPIGRGALTLGTARPLPTEPLVIPPLCLSGLAAQQNNAAINLDLCTAQNAPGGGAAADITAWAEFHNGAASGLRMAAEHEAAGDGSSAGPSSVAPLTRNWIVFHRPDSPSYTHAGLLMALGLAGHLAKLSWTDLYRYLSEQHDATTIGVLLGMAASRRGSMEALVSKMLFLHLPATHPASFPEIELSPLVQASALLGVGLLYEGSCHRLMVETMLSEIGRRPSSGANAKAAAASGNTKGDDEGGVVTDREGYALAAGLSLGLVALGAGSNAAGLADLNLEKRLRYYMLGAAEAGGAGCSTAGGTSPTANARGSGANFAGAGAIGGSTAEGYGSTQGFGRIGFDPTLGEERLQEMVSLQLAGLGRSLGAGREHGQEDGGSVPATAGTTARVVLEGPGLNLGVSAPGATLALALIYLKTGDAAVASSFVIPDTQATLQAVRPDLLTLRVLGRALVMWSDIRPTKQWVEAQMAPIFRAPLSYYLDRIARRKPAGTSQHPTAHGSGGLFSAPWAAARPKLAAGELATLAQAHLAALAGGCMALGLRYAGSGNSSAYDLLRHYVGVLLEAKRRVPDAAPPPVTSPMGAPAAAGAPPTDPATASTAVLSMHCVDKGHIESCLSVVVTALAVVMAGTGHLPTLRLIQALSLRRHPVQGADVSGLGITVGSHMMTNMAAGFLFLGAGNATFGTSNSAIAALLIALHPRLPLNTLDNSCHLQAFRHLYVLAAQPRCVEARDVDSKQLVYVPLGVTTSQQPEEVKKMSSKHRSTDATHACVTTSSRVAPCLLPEKSEVVQVAALGPRYWPQVLSRTPTQPHPNHPQSGRVPPLPFLEPAAFPAPVADCASPPGRAALQQDSMLPPGSRSVTPYAGGRPGGADMRSPQPATLPAAQGDFCYRGHLQGSTAPSHQAYPSALDRLYRQQLVFVKKRSGSLSYADDPSGIRSLLSRVSVLHTGGGQGGAAAPPPLLFTAQPPLAPHPASPTSSCCSAGQGAVMHGSHSSTAVVEGGLSARATGAVSGVGLNNGGGSFGSGSMEAWEDSEDDVGGADARSGAQVAGTRAAPSTAADGGSNDMVHLCATFSADPSIMALAQLLKQLGALQCSTAPRQRQPQQHHINHHYAARTGLCAGAAALEQHHLCHEQPQELQQQQHERQQQQQRLRLGRQWRATQRRQCAALLQFCTSSLYECITAEKAELLAAYLKLYCLVMGFSQAGCPAWLNGTGLLTTALRALPMACAYYTSPLSTACTMVASRPMHALHALSTSPHQHNVAPSAHQVVPPSSTSSGVHTGSGNAGSEAAAEHQQLWRPLLQPALVEGLWMRVQGVWGQLGMMGPSATPSTPATTISTLTNLPPPREPPAWALAAFVAAGTLPPAEQLSCLFAQCVADEPIALAQLGIVAPWAQGLHGEELRACLGACLQLRDVPYGEEVRAALASLRASPQWPRLQAMLRSAALKSRPEGGPMPAAGPAAAAGGSLGQGAQSVVSMALVPLLAAKVPQAPPAVVRLLASCCLPALLRNS